MDSIKPNKAESALSSEQLLKDLKGIIRGRVKMDEETLREHSRDASIFERKPQVVVFPKTADDISRLVQYVNLSNEHHQKLHLTARARGTGMTGGSLSDSIVVNVDKFLNGVEIVDEGELHAIVQSGVEFTLFEQQALPTHLTMPAYPSSKQYAAFGGMIANDCAGEKSLRYGKMHDFLDWVEVILSDGSVARFEELTREQVKAKMAGDGLEASIYRQLIPLVEKHQSLIEAHHPPVSKNSSGYALWRVWNRSKDTFNLAQLIVGSQGTLGIINRARVRLVHEKPHRTLVRVYLRDWQELPTIVSSVLPFEPEMLEAYDDTTLSVAMKYRADLAANLGISSFKLWKLFGSERKYRRKYRRLPPLTMLIELAESDVVGLNNKIAAVQQVLHDNKFDYHVVSDSQEYKKFWAIRRESYKLLKDNTPGITATVFIEDFCIRPQELPTFFPRMLQILQSHQIKATIAGHAGNGNFHIIPLMDMSLPTDRQKIVPVMKEIHDLIWAHGGTITAEHNDGILRTPFVEQQFGTDMYKLFREVKRVFDPNNIFNPGKKVGGTINDLEQSLIKENPQQKSKGIYA